MNPNETEPTTLSFHLFGDLSLEDPKQFLSETQLSELHRHLPLIQDLESNLKSHPETSWNLGSAFKELVEKETAAWRQLGVDRPPQHLLPPSGSTSSPLACHLFNPTFYVADPDDQVTDDPTSPTMRLIHASGFSSETCLMFDQVCRREDSLDVLWFYTEEIYKPHRDFVRDLRQHMLAVVEICWGCDAWTEIKRELGSRLIRFPLWGIFEPVRLYLEFGEDPRSLKRFILHVYHPQFFVRSGITKLGPEARTIFGKAQDLALTVASRLARIGTETHVNYFQTNQPSRKNCRILPQQEYLRQKNLLHARETLQAAFSQKYHERELQHAYRNEGLEEIKNLLQGLTKNPFKSMVRYSRVKISQDELESRSSKRYDKLTGIITTIEELRQEILHDEMFANKHGLEDIGRECLAWEALPKRFIDWLRSQEGLRINGEAILNRGMLETVYRLLHFRDNSTNASFDVTNSSVVELAAKVASGYIKAIISPRKQLIRDNTILGSPGQVIKRKCSACNMYALDDAFPLFCKNMPDRYVIVINHSSKSGCGRLGCMGIPSIIPTDARQKYVAPIQKGFEKALRAEEDVIKLFALLRSGSDLNDCAPTVLVKCPKCNHTREHRARWTIHDPPRFLQPHLSCSACGNRNAHFRAIDPQIPTTTEATLYMFLKSFREIGCNLMDFPKLPEIIFAKATYKKRFELLKQAKNGAHEPETTRKRKRDIP